MKRVAFVLLDGLSVFNHENVEYKPRTDRPIKEPTGIIEKCFTDSQFLVLQDESDCLLYVEGCINLKHNPQSSKDNRGGSHAWVFDQERELAYEFSPLPIDTRFGELIPKDSVEYYGCEFTKKRC